MKRLLFLTLALLISGCTKQEEKTSSRSSDEAVSGLCGENLRITNGRTCKDLYRSSIPLLQLELSSGGNAICTGTLITPKTILTAAHCVDPKGGVTAVLAGFPKDGEDSTGRKSFDVYRVASFKAHPLWDSVAGNPYDIGVVILEKEVEDRETVPLIGVSAHRAASDDLIGIYGYGKNENSDIGVLRYGEMILQQLETGLGYPDDLLGAEFNDTQQSICSGDSGGPAALEANNSFGIVGINSIGTSERCMNDSMAGFANIQIDKNFNFILESKEGQVGVVGGNGVDYF